MKSIKYIFLLIISISTANLFAQVPIPAPAQEKPILLKGGTAHLGNGQVIENANVAFEQGKITYVGVDSPGDESKYDVRNISGKHIYPGFIILNSQVGLDEVSSVRATRDGAETGELNPNVRSQIAFNTDSENIPAFRFNGILLAEATPQGGAISGSSSLMELDGWNWEDATHSIDVAIHMNWPGKNRRQFDFSTYTVSYGPNPDYDKTYREIKKLFEDSKAYKSAGSKDRNLKLESMLGLFDGSKVLIIHTEEAKGMVESVKFAQEMGVKRIAIVGDAEALFAADFLAENKIPVVLPKPHALPDRSDDDYDLPYKLAVELTKKGVEVTLSHSGMLANSRNLPFYAGTSVAWGMSKEDALKMITSNPAKLLGVDKRVGTLETGKDATLFISEGDALDMRTSVLISAFIGGREITLDARQQWLFKKYSDKYGH
ncbi:MAG: amidohydrolase family protein [Cyclobacteriaceae bacterium]|nr:amidohydrolase family protein [Cyclobacteriaceae bacterium]